MKSSLIDDFGRDIWIALRSSRRQATSTAVLVLTLALGIGTTTAVFSIIEAVFLRTLAVSHPEQLVLFSGEDVGGTRSSSPPPDGVWTEFSSDTFRSFQATPSTFASVAAFAASYDTVTVALASESKRQRASVSLVSGNYFDVLGVSAELGRSLANYDDELGATPVAIVSDEFWRGMLNADPHAVGSVLTVNETVFTIVGVAPPSFFGVRVRNAPGLWIPLIWQPEVQHEKPARLRPEYYWLNLIGRLAPGQTLGSAQTVMTDKLRRFLLSTAGDSPDAATLARIRRTDLTLVAGGRGLTAVRGRYLQPLVLMFAVVGLLLLIACANVAMLLLCRADSRRTEVAVRRAIGAGRGRLLRQWFTESVALATAGVGGGLALAHWAVGILQAYFYSGPNKVALNQEVLRFAVGITIAVCALFSLAPARYVSSIDELAALRSKTKGARARRTLAGRNALVVSQIALSLVLVTGATIFGRTLLNLEREPLGFDQDNVLLMRVNPRDAGYVPTNVGDLYRRLHDALSHLPGIDHVTFARYSPFSGSTSITGSTVEGYTPPPGQGVDLESVQVGPNYPETLGLTLVAGRAIGFGDRIGTERVAMVNEAFGRKFFPASSPVDHHARLGRDEYRVVGVIRDALFHTARDAAVPFVFVPMLQQTDQSALDCELEVRTHGDAQSIAPTIRDAVLAIDSRLSPGRARTLRAQVLETFRPERVIAGFVGVLALLALLVSAVGLYGVVSHGVAQRTREIGIRISLGASRDAVVLLLLREIAAPCVMGLAIGWVGVVLLAQEVRTQLFGVAATDFSSLALAASTLLIIAILASLIPAARALRVSPTVALNSE